MKRYLIIFFISCVFGNVFSQSSEKNDYDYIYHSKFIRAAIDSFFKEPLEYVCMEHTSKIDTTDFIPHGNTTVLKSDFASDKLIRGNKNSHYSIFLTEIGHKTFLEVLNNQVIDTDFSASKKRTIRERDYQNLKKGRKALRFIICRNSSDDIERIAVTAVYYD